MLFFSLSSRIHKLRILNTGWNILRQFSVLKITLNSKNAPVGDEATDLLGLPGAILEGFGVLQVQDEVEVTGMHTERVH